MTPTPEQLIAAGMPGSEAGLVVSMITYMKKQPVPTSTQFKATLIAPEDLGSQAITKALDDYHATSGTDLDAFFVATIKNGKACEAYLNLSTPGPHRVAVTGLEGMTRKVHFLARDNMAGRVRYRADVIKLGKRLDAKANWGKAAGALSTEQNAAIKAHRTGENMRYVVSSVKQITGIGTGTTADMPKGAPAAAGAAGARSLLNLYNPDLNRASPTGHGNYWLELVDPLHRSWGHQIDTMYTDWLHATTHLTFWDWLKQTKKAAGFASVAYLDPSQRWRYRITFDGGLLKYPVDNGDLKTFGTKRFGTAFSGKGFAIWVCDAQGNFYAGNHQVNEFHHSSFLAGGAAFGAGEWAVANGKIVFMSQKTGHYRTPSTRLFDIVRMLGRVTDVKETLIEVMNAQGKMRYCHGKDVIAAAGPVAATKLISAGEFSTAYDALRSGNKLKIFTRPGAFGAPDVEDRDVMLKIIGTRVAADSGSLEPPKKPPPIVT